MDFPIPSLRLAAPVAQGEDLWAISEAQTGALHGQLRNWVSRRRGGKVSAILGFRNTAAATMVHACAMVSAQVRGTSRHALVSS